MLVVLRPRSRLMLEGRARTLQRAITGFEPSLDPYNTVMIDYKDFFTATSTIIPVLLIVFAIQNANILRAKIAPEQVASDILLAMAGMLFILTCAESLRWLDCLESNLDGLSYWLFGGLDCLSK